MGKIYNSIVILFGVCGDLSQGDDVIRPKFGGNLFVFNVGINVIILSGLKSANGLMVFDLLEIKLSVVFGEACLNSWPYIIVYRAMAGFRANSYVEHKCAFHVNNMSGGVGCIEIF